MTPDARKIVENSALLKGAPPESAERLIGISREHHYQKGESICHRDQPATSIGIVTRGLVKLYRIAPNGNETVVRVCEPGISFGEVVALRKRPYPVSVMAVVDASVAWVDADQLLEHLKGDPELLIGVLSSTFSHLHELVNQVEQLKSQSGTRRVARFLLNRCSAREGAGVVEFPYDKFLVAGQLGIQPESLSRALAKLREYGVTVQQSEARIDDIARLRDYADEKLGEL